MTFPEGFTALQMADRLTEAGLQVRHFFHWFEEPKEEWRSEFLRVDTAWRGFKGFFFPDTYRFDRQADAEKYRSGSALRLSEKAPLFSGQSLPDAYETLVLSSIVETEVRSDRDRSLVAGIFLRRLSIGQPLQSDATVKYVLGLNKVQHSFEETRTDSPYNTYVHKGLPPGPIANPGLSAITATLNPVQNKTFYFLSDPKTGETVLRKPLRNTRNKAA